MARILIVDDEMLIALAVSMLLEDAGHEVVLAPNGSRGLQQAQKTPPDLIVTDYMMPRMDGLQMIAALRESGNAVPIILATAVPQDSLPVAGPALYDAYLTKPYHEKPLLEIVNRLLRPGTEPA